MQQFVNLRTRIRVFLKLLVPAVCRLREGFFSRVLVPFIKLARFIVALCTLLKLVDLYGFDLFRFSVGGISLHFQWWPLLLPFIVGASFEPRSSFVSVFIFVASVFQRSC